MEEGSAIFHYRGQLLSRTIKPASKTLRRGRKKIKFLDAGCGDGRGLFNFYRLGLLTPKDEVSGVDLSEKRLKVARKMCPQASFLKADVCHLPFEKESFDFVYSWMVIEHVKDDALMLKELSRVLRPGGQMIIATVVKKSYGIYIYRRSGKFVLGPTHVREYGSREEFISLLKKHQFSVRKIRSGWVTWPVLDLVLRLGVKLGLTKMETTSTYFERHPFLERLSFLKIPILGFLRVEVWCQK